MLACESQAKQSWRFLRRTAGAQTQPHAQTQPQARARAYTQHEPHSLPQPKERRVGEQHPAGQVLWQPPPNNQRRPTPKIYRDHAGRVFPEANGVADPACFLRCECERRAGRRVLQRSAASQRHRRSGRGVQAVVLAGQADTPLSPMPLSRLHLLRRVQPALSATNFAGAAAAGAVHAHERWRH